MSIKLSPNIPANVVEIGNEITQNVVDALNGSVSPSSSNVLTTRSDSQNQTAIMFGRTVRNRIYTGLDFATVTVSGGASTVSAKGVQIETSNTTSGSYAQRSVISSNNGIESIGKTRGILNWSNAFTVSTAILRHGTLDANTAVRFTIGKQTGDNRGEFPNSRKGIGFVIQGTGNFQVIAGNGTTASKSTNGTVSLADTTAVNIEVRSDGAGNVTLFVNDTQVASLATGPTGDGDSSTSNNITVEIENVATATATSAISISNVYVRQS